MSYYVDIVEAIEHESTYRVNNKWPGLCDTWTPAQLEAVLNTSDMQQVLADFEYADY